MPNNTDSPAQAKRRKDAIQSAINASVWLSLSAAVLLFLRQHYGPGGFWGAVLGLSAVLELGTMVPIWILLKERLKEIQGGEEDAAAQY